MRNKELYGSQYSTEHLEAHEDLVYEQLFLQSLFPFPETKRAHCDRKHGRSQRAHHGCAVTCKAKQDNMGWTCIQDAQA